MEGEMERYKEGGTGGGMERKMEAGWEEEQKNERMTKGRRKERVDGGKERWKEKLNQGTERRKDTQKE